MTTATPGPGRERPRRQDWLDHRAPFVMIISYFVLLLYMFTTGWLSSGILALAILLQLRAITLIRRHNHRLCAECIDSWPVDPQAEIDRRRFWLAAEHRFNMNPLTIVCVLFGIAAIMVAGLFVLPGIIPAALAVLINLVFLPMTTWASWVHQRLEPWCPWCRRGGGGDDYFDPEPEPDPSKTKDLELS